MLADERHEAGHDLSQWTATHLCRLKHLWSNLSRALRRRGRVRRIKRMQIRVRVTVHDVVLQRVREQIRLLRHQTELCAKPADVQCRDVDIVQKDLQSGTQIEPNGDHEDNNRRDHTPACHAIPPP